MFIFFGHGLVPSHEDEGESFGASSEPPGCPQFFEQFGSHGTACAGHFQDEPFPGMFGEKVQGRDGIVQMVKDIE